jgi:hypothetical protein
MLVRVITRGSRFKRGSIADQKRAGHSKVKQQFFFF